LPFKKAATSRAIIPVLRGECEIPLTLARLKYLDPTSDDFDRQASQLLNAIDKESVATRTSDQVKSVTETVELRVRRHEIEHPGGPLRRDAGIYVEPRSDRAVSEALDSG
jgi:hypothetical protein